MSDDKNTPLQSKLVSIRTILDPRDVVRWVLEYEPETAIAWARHEDTDTTHSHIMIRFPSVRRWGWLRQKLVEAGDSHNRCVPGDSWRRGCRYLLHLDNPEKAVIPRSSLCTKNLDEDEVAQLMAGRSSALLPALREAFGLSPYDAFSFLVEKRGFKPHECTSAINLLMALERAKSVRSSLGTTYAMPETEDERNDRIDDEELDVDYLAYWDRVEKERERF